MLDDRSVPQGEPYRPLGRRAQIATILLVLVIGTSIAGVLSGLMERSLLEEAQEGRFVSVQEADDNDRRQVIVAVVDGIAFFVAAAFFLFWFHRAYRNVSALRGMRRYGTGWAIGGWFVPILNLWRPKQVVNDIWRETKAVTTDDYGPVTTEGDSVPNVFLLWWIVWIVMGSVYWSGLRSSLDAVTIDELLASNAVYLAADILSILAAALAVVLVQRVTAREEERARLLDLIPDDDRTPLWRRKSSWVVALCVVAAVAAQTTIAVASFSDSLSGESESAAESPPGRPGGVLVADNFSLAGPWLVDDDANLTFDVVEGKYRILLKKQGLWSSLRPLPNEVDSLSMEAEASAEDVDLRTDFYGIACLTATSESFLFGMSPDGYYTVAFDPGRDQNLDFQRLIEDAAPQRFSTPHAVNRLRAECVDGGDAMKLRFFVDDKRLAETQHESSGRLAGVELFVYSEKGGTDIRFDNVRVESVTE